MSAIFVATLTHLAYMLPGGFPHQFACSAPQVARGGPIFAFDDGQRKETLERNTLEQSVLWEKTDNLSYKNVVTPEDDAAVTPLPDQIVAVHFSASYITSGKVIETTVDGRPLTFKLGDGTEPLFQEAVAGMRVGGKRRVNLAPGTYYANPKAKETIQFEVELVGIQTGKDALIFNLLRNRDSIINAAIVASFTPDILGFLGLLPAAAPDGGAALNAAFSSGGFGAVDVLSGAAASATASAPFVVDAANQWAAQGLQGLM